MPKRHLLGAIPVALASVVAAHQSVGAGEASRRLQGLFCNSEAQIASAAALMARGLHPTTVASSLNQEQVVCTHVDRLHFVIDDPVALAGGAGPLTRYRGLLRAVVAGEAVRPVSPPVEMYFLTPERLTGVPVEHRS